MVRLYQVTFRWVVSPPKSTELEPVFASLGDWARLNAYSWFLSSDQAPENIFNTLIRHIKTEDSVVIVAVDLGLPAQGWAPQWFWEWINKKRGVVQNVLGALLPRLPPKK